MYTDKYKCWYSTCFQLIDGKMLKLRASICKQELQRFLKQFFSFKYFSHFPSCCVYLLSWFNRPLWHLKRKKQMSNYDLAELSESLNCWNIYSVYTYCGKGDKAFFVLWWAPCPINSRSHLYGPSRRFLPLTVMWFHEWGMEPASEWSAHQPLPLADLPMPGPELSDIWSTTHAEAKGIRLEKISKGRSEDRDTHIVWGQAQGATPC